MTNTVRLQHSSYDWTEARIADLKALWAEGLSGSEIARELGGGLTRNSVIGKVHRLKLKPRRPAAPKLSRVPGPSAPSKPTAKKKRRTPTAATKAKLEIVQDEQTQEIFIPLEDRIGVMGLTEDTCKWPIGDPLAADFHFCGQQSQDHKPYCEFHSGRAHHVIVRERPYSPISRRRA